MLFRWELKCPRKKQEGEQIAPEIRCRIPEDFPSWVKHGAQISLQTVQRPADED
jgi:hypothetical protein